MACCAGRTLVDSKKRVKGATTGEWCSTLMRHTTLLLAAGICECHLICQDTFGSRKCVDSIIYEVWCANWSWVSLDN